MKMQSTRTAVCTLSDSSFEKGCGALLNSLHSSGYRGKVLVGLVGRGHRLLEGARTNAPDGLEISFVDLPDRKNVNAHKPFLLEKCFEQQEINRVFFFDADIICTRNWLSYEDWADHGVAVCSDINYLWMPTNHPQRGFYRRALGELGLEAKPVVGHANGGFLGLRRQHIGLIEIWSQIINWIDSAPSDWDAWSFKAGFSKYDQDALNAALMAVDAPISFVGHEGMSFNGSVGYMIHPIGSRKPWNRGFLKDLLVNGRGLPLAARQYWRHVSSPIEVMGRRERMMARVEMDVTAALSRLIAR